MDLTLVLHESRPETPTIRSFRFVPREAFARKPGQYLMMKLDVTDPRGPYRSFTIASSPTEDSVTIATRVIGRSPFKHKLASLEPFASVAAKGPLGKFTLHDESSLRAVFVVGGIGITPARSMMRYATDERLPMDLLLLYSARSEEEIAFRGELDGLAAQNPRLRIVYTLTRAGNAWNGARGHIDRELLRREAGDLADAVFYVSGRPSFVTDVRTAVMELGVPRERVLSEQFPGYE